MDYLNQNISMNLKRIRLARGYSLDMVAEQTGVSKSMLGQIERGEANPTIGILGKIYIYSDNKTNCEQRCLLSDKWAPFFHAFHEKVRRAL